MKKTTILFLLLLVIASGRMSAQKLVLHHANGSTTEVELFTKPLIQFQGEKLTITSPVLSLEYNRADILRLTYLEGDPTGISAQRGDIDYSHEGDRLVFRGVQPQATISVFNAGGVRVPAVIERSEDSAVLSLPSLPAGVYVVNINGRTAKITLP